MWERFKPNDSWLTFLLVWGLVTLVAAAIGAANLVLSFDMQPILLWTTTLGVISGMALAKSRFPGLTASIYAIVYGTFVTGLLIGRTYEPDMVWRERVADMVMRQVEFFTRISQGNTNRDALIFVVHTTVVLWILSVTAAWWTYRRPRPWLVVLPSALTMLSVIYYASPTLIWYLALFCLIAMLYIAHTHLLDNKRIWQRARVHYNSNISGNFMRSSLVVALLALALVWRAPALPANAAVGDAINRVNSPWRQVRNNWQRVYSALNAQSAVTSDPYRNTLSLGGPRNPTDAPIMDVFVDEKLPYAYWRAAVLDNYDASNGEWFGSEAPTITQYPDDPPLTLPDTRDREIVEQRFVNYIPNAGTIYAAPDLLSSDRQIRVKAGSDGSGNDIVYAARSRYLLELNDSYVVRSQLSVADQTSLRSATRSYPPEIAAQYLNVPVGISERVRSLAVNLTSAYDNPYDQALAVQNYLRNTMTYNDQIAAPPNGAEPIDYFLFETREGYCNYYASAFAMMLRVQGIPTRLSRGYASGEFNEDNSLYRVRARDAHVWPEVYFPEFGWIQFEPTVIVDPVDRPVGEGLSEDLPMPPPFEASLFEDEGEEPFEDELNPDELLEEFGEEDAAPVVEQVATEPGLFDNVNWVQVGGAMAVLGVAAMLIAVANRMNRSVEGTIDGSYGRLEMWGRWLKLPMTVSQTPIERGNLLIDAVPEGAGPVQRLVGAFVQKQFGPKKSGRFRVNPLNEWRTLRPLLFKRGLRNRLSLRRRRQKKSSGD